MLPKGQTTAFIGLDLTPMPGKHDRLSQEQFGHCFHTSSQIHSPYFAVGFKLDYVKADGDLSNYVPDLIVRDSSGVIWVIETKGRKELDLPQKMARLKQWCADATAAEENGQRYDFIFVDQAGFEKHTSATLPALAAAFTDKRS